MGEKGLIAETGTPGDGALFVSYWLTIYSKKKLNIIIQSR